MTTHSEAITGLIKILESSNTGSGIRCAAAEGLGYAGGSEARTHLLKIMTSTNTGADLRAAAAKALGHAAKG
jgi:HEAT repeat protein